MKTNKKILPPKFHAVGFMREVRKKLSEQFLKDRQKYLEFLKKAMSDFKSKQRIAAK